MLTPYSRYWSHYPAIWFTKLLSGTGDTPAFFSPYSLTGGLRQPHAGRCNIIPQLLDGGGADDDARYHRLAQQPGEGDLRHRHAMRFRDWAHSIDTLEGTPLVQVDVLELQALQARVDLIEEMMARLAAPIRRVVHDARGLGRNDQVIARQVELSLPIDSQMPLPYVIVPKHSSETYKPVWRKYRLLKGASEAYNRVDRQFLKRWVANATE
jgi:hypothetical protein